MTEKKEFDFYQHVHSVLRERTSSGFIPYHELYAYLGRRYCLKKDQVKELIKSMDRSGYLKIKKRGIILIQNSPGRNGLNEKGGERHASDKPDRLRECAGGPEELPG